MKDSPRPRASAEMALIRLAYASDLPTPEEALANSAKRATARGMPRCSSSRWRRPTSRAEARRVCAAPAEPALSPSRPAAPAPPNGPGLARFEDIVAFARAKRDLQLVQALEREVRLARFEPGSIAFTPVEGAAASLAQTLARRLQEWTGERWMVALVAGSKRRRCARRLRRARPNVQAALRRIRWSPGPRAIQGGSHRRCAAAPGCDRPRLRPKPR